MTRLAEWCMLSFGWRRVLLLLAAGALAGLSMPPFFILPALFVSLPVWVWTLDGAETGKGWRRLFGAPFAIGFWFGFGYFLVAIHWIGAAFFVDGGWLLGLMPFAVAALAAILALFWGLASASAHLFWNEGPRRILVLAMALTLVEFARGHLFTGFPFDLLGYALTANPAMMQAASLIGVYGLTLAVILMAATPALIWPADQRPLTARLLPFFAALAVLAAQLGYGEYRLRAVDIVKRDDMRLRLVQPNIPQAVKWQADSGNFVLDRLISLSERGSGAGDPGLVAVTHLVWPESAFPFYLSEHPAALARIARMLPRGTLLITGAPWLDPADPDQQIAYNAILAIDSTGEIVAGYNKAHLVPFGEYLPFKEFFARFGLRQFVAGDEGWTAGPPRRLMTPPDTPPFLPLVCYEAVFSADLGADVGAAAFLLNLTNDGWFDFSIGPAQHFHHARLRAVEEGKPMIRIANTGVTALIDPLGRIEASLSPNQAGLLDVVPAMPLEAPPFARWRHLPLFAALAALGLGLAVAARLGRRHGQT